jgi:hypothetical protein
MSVETVRADIAAAVERIRLEGAVPTMRMALMTYWQACFGERVYGLTPNDKQARAAEEKRVAWLLTEIFPEEDTND